MNISRAYTIGDVIQAFGMLRRKAELLVQLGVVEPSGPRHGRIRLFTQPDLLRFGVAQRLEDVWGIAPRNLSQLATLIRDDDLPESEKSPVRELHFFPSGIDGFGLRLLRGHSEAEKSVVLLGEPTGQADLDCLIVNLRPILAKVLALDNALDTDATGSGRQE